MLPTNREPASPGEILREEYLEPMGMTQQQLAEALRVSVQTVNLLINGKRAITADTALGLADVFETTPEFWMNLQTSVDLWAAMRRRTAAHKPSTRANKEKSSARAKHLIESLKKKGKFISLSTLRTEEPVRIKRAAAPGGHVLARQGSTVGDRTKPKAEKPTASHRGRHDA